MEQGGRRAGGGGRRRATMGGMKRGSAIHLRGECVQLDVRNIYRKWTGESLWVLPWTSLRVSGGYKMENHCSQVKKKCQNVTLRVMAHLQNTKILTGREKQTIDRQIKCRENTKMSDREWQSQSAQGKWAGIRKGPQLRRTLQQGGWAARLGRLHNVGLVKRLSRGIYGWQEQGHKSDVVTRAGAADRRSTVQQWRPVKSVPTGK